MCTYSDDKPLRVYRSILRADEVTSTYGILASFSNDTGANPCADDQGGGVGVGGGGSSYT